MMQRRRGTSFSVFSGVWVAALLAASSAPPAAAEVRSRTVGSASDAERALRSSAFDRSEGVSVFGTVTRSASQVRQQGFSIDTPGGRSTVAESAAERFGSVRQTASEARASGERLDSAKRTRDLEELGTTLRGSGSVTRTRSLPDTIGVETLRRRGS